MRPYPARPRAAIGRTCRVSASRGRTYLRLTDRAWETGAAEWRLLQQCLIGQWLGPRERGSCDSATGFVEPNRKGSLSLVQPHGAMEGARPTPRLSSGDSSNPSLGWTSPFPIWSPLASAASAGICRRTARSDIDRTTCSCRLDSERGWPQRASNSAGASDLR